MLAQLRRSNYEPRARRVDCEETLLAALALPTDLIVADASVPGLDARRLLQLVRERAPSVPVIIVSSTSGEEFAVELMQQGAADYVLKDRLSRLGPAVTRALDQRRARGDMRAADDSFRASEARLRLALDGGQMGLWEWNVRTGRAVWNAREYELLGLPTGTGDEPGERFFEYIHPDDVARVRRVAERSLASGEDFDTEMRVNRADGQMRWLVARGRVERDAQGRPAVMIGVNYDITERRRLEEQLRQSQKMDAIGQLAGGVAHDFNNLLTVILGYSELALAALLPAAGEAPAATEAPAAAEAREHVIAIRHAGERAAALTRHLLAFSRRQMLEPKVLDLNDVVAGAEKMLQRLIGEGIALATVLAPNLPKVRIDPGQIEQVILNLAFNARDAMPEGGRLFLETHLDECATRPPHDGAAPPPVQHVRLTVRDTGAGIPPEVKPRIFEPFFTTKAIGRGTGLGLATVYGIVQQSGGWIDVTSRSGAGATFDIYFPAIEIARSTPSPAAASSDVAGLETILLVEDDAAVRVLTRQALERQGYRILEAAGGRDALRVAEANAESIDLLITDVVMPELGGRELAEALIARRPALKVLFVSGYTEDGLLRQGIAQAKSAYLQKPFTLLALARRVREILGQRF